MHSNQNKTLQLKTDIGQTNKNNFEPKEDLANLDKKQRVNETAESISELKLDQAEDKENKASKNAEVNAENKDKNINTKSLV